VGPQSRLAGGVLTFLAALGLVGCESLRPEVADPKPEAPSADLIQARKLIAKTAAPHEITAALRRVLGESSDEDEIEEARRGIAQQHLQWFQLAHIAQDLLVETPGHNRLFGSLVLDLSVAPEYPEPIKLTAGASKAGSGRHFEPVTRLADYSSKPVMMAATKGALAEALIRTEQSNEPTTRAFVAAGRRFLALESAWRYGRQWRTTPTRVTEMAGFAKRTTAGALADNAWLTLQLSFALALDKPLVPRRTLIESAAAALGHKLEGRRQAPYEVLVELGQVQRAPQATLPEHLWQSWRALRLRIDAALSDLKRGNGDAPVLWEQLRAIFKLRPIPKAPTVAALYAMAASVRRQAVTQWAQSLNLSDLRTPDTLDKLEATAAKLYAEDKRADAIWVMAVLMAQEAISVHVADTARPYTIRLVERAEFKKRSLVLPGGIVYPDFPRKVRECLIAKNPARRDCIRRMVAGLVKRVQQHKPK